MWDLLHPREVTRGQIPSNPFKYRRPLPEIKRTESYEHVWQKAPYASDFQADQFFQQPRAIKQIDMN
jgi:hypothetical protein